MKATLTRTSASAARRRALSTPCLFPGDSVEEGWWYQVVYDGDRAVLGYIYHPDTCQIVHLWEVGQEEPGFLAAAWQLLRREWPVVVGAAVLGWVMVVVVTGGLG